MKLATSADYPKMTKDRLNDSIVLLGVSGNKVSAQPVHGRNVPRAPLHARVPTG